MRNRLVWPISFVLLGATLAVYAPVLSHAFLGCDDGMYITANPVVQRGLTLAGWRWAWTTFDACDYWHPLTWLSHMLDCQVFGALPAGHHLTNLLFHLANTVLLFLVLRRMTGTVWRSALVAALFALHPLNVESVAWAAERKNVLSTFFGLLALGAYVHYVERPRVLWYGLLLAAFAMSLLAKPMLVTLPFLLFLLDFWPLRRFPAGAASSSDPSPGTDAPAFPPVPLRRLLFEKAPLLVLSAACCAITAWAARATHGAISLTRMPLGARFANAVVAYAVYLRKMVWPTDLTLFYPHSGTQIPWASVLCAGLALAVLTALAVVLRRRRPALLVGWLWFLGTLIPVIGVLQIGRQSMADRFTYFPLIGIFVALAWTIPERWAGRPWPRAVLAAAVGGVLSACTLATGFQLSTWQDDGTVWAHALRVTENNPFAEFSFGTYLYNHGHKAEGLEHLQRAARLDPGDAMILNNLGMVLLDQGKVTEAADLFGRATAEAPWSIVYQNGLGLALVRQGRLDEARRAFEEAIRLAPETPEPHFNLGAVLAEQGDHIAAAANYEAGLRRDPNWPWWAYRRALSLLHEEDPAYRNAAEALWRARQADAATAGRFPEIQALLAEAYAANGRMTEAVGMARRALSATGADADPDFVHVLRAALRRYEWAARQANAPATP